MMNYNLTLFDRSFWLFMCLFLLSATCASPLQNIHQFPGSHYQMISLENLPIKNGERWSRDVQFVDESDNFGSNLQPTPEPNTESEGILSPFKSLYSSITGLFHPTPEPPSISAPTQTPPTIIARTLSTKLPQRAYLPTANAQKRNPFREERHDYFKPRYSNTGEEISSFKKYSPVLMPRDQPVQLNKRHGISKKSNELLSRKLPMQRKQTVELINNVQRRSRDLENARIEGDIDNFNAGLQPTPEPTEEPKGIFQNMYDKIANLVAPGKTEAPATESTIAMKRVTVKSHEILPPTKKGNLHPKPHESFEMTKYPDMSNPGPVVVILGKGDDNTINPTKRSSGQNQNGAGISSKRGVSIGGLPLTQNEAQMNDNNEESSYLKSESILKRNSNNIENMKLSETQPLNTRVSQSKSVPINYGSHLNQRNTYLNSASKRINAHENVKELSKRNGLKMAESIGMDTSKSLPKYNYESPSHSAVSRGIEKSKESKDLLVEDVRRRTAKDNYNIAKTRELPEVNKKQLSELDQAVNNIFVLLDHDMSLTTSAE